MSDTSSIGFSYRPCSHQSFYATPHELFNLSRHFLFPFRWHECQGLGYTRRGLSGRCGLLSPFGISRLRWLFCSQCCLYLLCCTFLFAKSFVSKAFV
ncbi:hypothetical protein K458DRAFT_169903 [Lentithecium fluviatile CBS 122367]|uniref:Uncharacterized protein n=1 Tax=Lentithecium fluviatile CBS 122367 TaxID=1168545 RepID=A0A6G1JC11_9PLEO|nr:hypothetical protein K458DRAFT_169903 [Lentithecium fluviatile CBS 122367]